MTSASRTQHSTYSRHNKHYLESKTRTTLRTCAVWCSCRNYSKRGPFQDAIFFSHLAAVRQRPVWGYEYWHSLSIRNSHDYVIFHDPRYIFWVSQKAVCVGKRTAAFTRPTISQAAAYDSSTQTNRPGRKLPTLACGAPSSGEQKNHQMQQSVPRNEGILSVPQRTHCQARLASCVR